MQITTNSEKFSLQNRPTVSAYIKLFNFAVPSVALHYVATESLKEQSEFKRTLMFLGSEIP